MESNNSLANIDTQNKKSNLLQKIKQNKAFKTVVIIATMAIIGGSVIYWKNVQGRIYIEKAEVSAPIIDLASRNSGILLDVFIREGDKIEPNTLVARVGNELIKSKAAGIIVLTKNDIGKIFNPGEAVVSMIIPDEMRIIGRIEEDKGLKDISVGQKAIFTVDAFPGIEYEGTVDEVSPTSRNSDIVFSISDKREVKEFNIKVRFNINKYPELKNGMSAKLWIYK